MSLPKLDPLPDSHYENFFKKFATLREPEDAYRAWVDAVAWNRLGDSAKRLKAMEIAACVSEVTIRNYLHSNPVRRMHVGPPMQLRLGLMAKFLGIPADFPLPPGQPTGSIALLTRLEVLSVQFHFELIRCLVCEASRQGRALSLHECTSQEMADVIASTQARHRPDGYIMVRMTPSRAALELLRQISTPVVLIQGAVLQYRPPVLAHVFPDQSEIPAGLALWVTQLRGEKRWRVAPKVVVVAVEDEESANHDWPQLEAGTPILRNQRKLLVMEALAHHGVRPTMAEVKDYSSHRALAVFQRHPDADAYVCMSDSLAVGIKQAFILTGRPWQGRILGFDNTQLALEEGISSFEQSRSETAKLAIGALTRFLKPTAGSGSGPGAGNGWPEPQHLRIKVSLKLRPQPGEWTPGSNGMPPEDADRVTPCGPLDVRAMARKPGRARRVRRTRDSGSSPDATRDSRRP